MVLKQKIALVTGGSGSIGGEIATALAAIGVSVAVSFASRPEEAAEVVEQIQAAGARGLAVRLDQRDPASITAAADAVVREFGGLDILVNNAAYNVGIPFADLDSMTPDIWDDIVQANLRGPFLLTRAFARHLKASPAGRVVNIASVGGLYPASSSIAYSASKAGLIHMTRCLAVALAPEVTVNCIAPGMVEGTRMMQRVPEEVVQFARDQAVLGRAASARDISNQVIMFCRAESVTGQVLVIDGGMPGCMH